MSTRRSASIQSAKDGNSVLFARHPTTNELSSNDLDSQPMLPRIDNEEANRLSTSRSPTDSATDTDAPLVIVSSGRRAISLKLILPTLLVIVGTAGMATLLLLWLLLHRIQNNHVWKDRAFLLNEGVKLEGGHEAARLLGLTIISAASKVVSCVTPALIFLYSFYLARFWLSQRDTYSGGSNLPTPLQYGLVVSLLSEMGLGSMLSTSRYLVRGNGRRAKASSILCRAFFMCLLVYILTNVLGIVDIWLHAVTTTIIQPTITSLDTPFKFGVDQVLCPPYPDPWYEAISPCLMQSGGWGGGVSSKIPGMLVTANNSDSLETITLADANDMAILVKPNIPRDLMFRARSFGARASCQSINHLCKENPVVNCTGFPSTFPPYNALKPSGSTQLTEGDSRLFIQSSNCPWDIACPHIPSDQITNVAATLNSTVPPVNAYNLWMQFAWEAEGDQDYGLSQNVSDAIGSYGNVATMLTNCTLYFYNVTVDYNNGSYFLVDEELSNVGLSDGLGAPARLGHFASHLISNIEGRAFTDTSTGDLMTYLQQDLSRLALGSAAVITNISTDTLSQSSLGSVIVGRYPFWPIVIFLALLYLLAALALVLFLVMMISNRAESVVFRGDSRDGGGRQMSILELTQMRLRSPLCLVAALFPPHRNETNRGALSIETNELNLFDEKSNDERVQVGLHSEGSEFGVFREQLWQSEEGGRWTKPRTQMKQLN